MRAPLVVWLTGVAVCSVAVSATAERRPARVYSVGDGLSSPFIKDIAQGPEGFLWVGSRNGLDRFDGFRFVRYGAENGLPDTTVTDITLARDGSLWLATNGGGLVHFDPSRRTDVTSTANTADRWHITRLPGGVRENRVNRVVEARDGRLWAGTDGGLFREDAVGSGRFATIPLRTAADPGISALVEDSNGVLWAAGTATGLQGFGPDGAPRDLVRGGALDSPIYSMIDVRGDLWAASRAGLTRLRAGPHGRSVVRTYGQRDGLPSDFSTGLLETRDGRLWVSTTGGLAVVTPTPSAAGEVFVRYPSAPTIDGPLFEDGDGNVWGGSPSGLVKIVADGFGLYDDLDRPGLRRTVGFLRQPDGTLYATTEDGSICRLSDLSTGPMPLPTWLGHRWLAQAGTVDRDGNWWLLGRDVVHRYRAPEVAQGRLHFSAPALVLDRRSGLLGSPYRVFADSRGDVWLGFYDGPAPRVARWRRATGRIEPLEIDAAAFARATPWAFAEDPSGNVWIGFEEGPVVRVAPGGTVLVLDAARGWPHRTVTTMWVDRVGRVWIGTIREGAWRIDQPGAAEPRARKYTMTEGLVANDVRSLAEDAHGRIYIGTVRGVDRLDPDTGHIRHYSTDDGLGSDFLMASDRDAQGRVWFAALSGLAWLEPRVDPSPVSPTVRIQGVTVGGTALPLAETGVDDVEAFEMPSGQQPLRIDFLALTFRPGDRMRYRYRLGDADWTPATDERFVTYASLPSGTHRFEVEAINAGGLRSARSATVSFHVLAPIWQRWWFLLGVVAVVAAALTGAHRLRVARLMAIERLRTRIADDLHDYIGSGLTHVVLLNELIERRAVDRESTELTNRLREAAVDMTEALGDIVWALSPTNARASDLVHRMRRFAGDVTAGAGLALRFETTAAVDVTLPIDVRREAYLVFKEALHNAVRHAECRTVSVRCALDPDGLDLLVEDDGRGLEVTSAAEGHGLASMRARAQRVGGRLTIEGRPGRGTRVELHVPLRRRRVLRIPA